MFGLLLLWVYFVVRLKCAVGNSRLSSFVPFQRLPAGGVLWEKEEAEEEQAGDVVAPSFRAPHKQMYSCRSSIHWILCSSFPTPHDPFTSIVPFSLPYFRIAVLCPFVLAKVYCRFWVACVNKPCDYLQLIPFLGSTLHIRSICSYII